jgi:cell fate (sporulation/competence/biofilm development) regulator YlbF (YheA/YmcA/DUF963 family)
MKEDIQHQNILAKVEELTTLIKGSDDYDCYQRRLARIRNKPDLYDQFNAFRKELMIRRLESFDEGLTAEVESLYREYSALLNDPMINSFLTAEQRVCALMRQVYDDMAAQLPLDYSYMDGKNYEE